MNNHWELWLWCCTWLQSWDKYFSLWKNIARPFMAVSGWHLSLDLHQKLPLITECPLLRSCSVLRQSRECHLLLLTYKKIILHLCFKCFSVAIASVGVWGQLLDCVFASLVSLHWGVKVASPPKAKDACPMARKAPTNNSSAVPCRCGKLMPCIKWHYHHSL